MGNYSRNECFSAGARNRNSLEEFQDGNFIAALLNCRRTEEIEQDQRIATELKHCRIYEETPQHVTDNTGYQRVEEPRRRTCRAFYSYVVAPGHLQQN